MMEFESHCDGGRLMQDWGGLIHTKGVNGVRWMLLLLEKMSGFDKS